MIPVSNVEITYLCDGVAKEFPFPYEYYDKSHVVGFVIGADGITTKITTNFTFNEVSKKFIYPVEGTALTSGNKIKLRRITELSQTLDLPNEYPFGNIEKAQDKLTMIMQEVSYIGEKSIPEIEQSMLINLNTVIQSKTDTLNYRNQAETFKNSANTSANNAKTSETNSKTSENNAKLSENNAKTSETNSKLSENNAKTSETNSKSSENNAKLSETNAKLSENNAKIYAEQANEGFNIRKNNRAYVAGDVTYSLSMPSWTRLDCIQGGTTADVEPTWGTVTEGQEVTDGTVKWRVSNVRDNYTTISEATGYGIISGGDVTVSGMIATLNKLVAHMTDGLRYDVSQATFTIPTADVTNPRIDLLYLSSAGIITYVAGTATSTPSVPPLPSGALSLATISVLANATTGTVTDTRVFKARYQNTGIINVKDFGAVGDGVTDDSYAINKALSTGKSVYFPAGKYYHTKPLNLTSRNIGNNNYGYRTIFGDGAGKTIFWSCTGDYPAIDCTGSSYITLRDFKILADNATPSGTSNAKIGIVDRRGTSSELNNYCHFNTFKNITINLQSDLTANGGAGTIGILHFGGEHCHYADIDIYANLPLYCGNILSLTVSSGYDLDNGAYEKPSTSSWSCTILTFTNLALVSYDSARAITLNQIALATFKDIYTSNRVLGGTWSTNTIESIYMSDCTYVDINVYQETTGILGSVYKLDHRFLTLNNIINKCRVYVNRVMGPSTSYVNSTAQAFIYMTQSTVSSIINSDFHCEINVVNYNISSDLISYAGPIAFEAGFAKKIANCTFILDKSDRTANFLSTVSIYVTNCVCKNYISGNQWDNINHSVGTWTPRIYMGTTNTTYPLTSSTGYYSINNKVVDVWFDVIVTSTLTSGNNVVISLPVSTTYYSTIKGEVTAFTGITLTGESGTTGYTQLNVKNYGSYEIGLFVLSGSAKTQDTLGFASIAAGARLSGHISYLID